MWLLCRNQKTLVTILVSSDILISYLAPFLPIQQASEVRDFTARAPNLSATSDMEAEQHEAPADTREKADTPMEEETSRLLDRSEASQVESTEWAQDLTPPKKRAKSVILADLSSPAPSSSAGLSADALDASDRLPTTAYNEQAQRNSQSESQHSKLHASEDPNKHRKGQEDMTGDQTLEPLPSRPTTETTTSSTAPPPSKKKKTTSSSSTSAASKAKKAASKKASSSSAASSKTKQKTETRSPSPLPILTSNVQFDQQQEEEEEDHNLYCICKSRYDDVSGGMIMCDRCDQWYHYRCMGITEEDVELVDQFICPPCQEETDQRTTYKTACGRAGCRHAALKPLSKYCSERCGVLAISTKMNALKVTKNKSAVTIFEEDARVRTAVKKEGLTDRNDDVVIRQDWSKAFRQLARGDQSAVLSASHRFAFVQAAASPQIFSTPELKDPADDWDPNPEPKQPIRIPSPMIELLETLHNLQVRLTALDIKKQRINACLDRLDLRSTFLHLVSDRVSTLPQVGASSFSVTVTAGVQDSSETEAGPAPKSKSKKKRGSESTASSGGPRCGYDERLHWDDEAFDSWACTENGRKILSQEVPLDGVLDDEDVTTDSMDVDGAHPGQPQARICAIGKRKCRRHADWSNLKESCIDVEKIGLNEESQKVSQEKLQLETQMEYIRQRMQVVQDLDRMKKEASRKADAVKDEELARMIAMEGTRRSGVKV